MTVIPLDMSIHRNKQTGKKQYKHLHTNKILNRAIIPKNWQNTTEFNNLVPVQAPSHALRCDDDLIVVDCDTIDTTEFIDSKLVPVPAPAEHYIVISDKGEKHFYFKPTEYYRNSLIYKNSRLALGKIDVLHGRSLVFAPCEHNTTKSVYSGSLEHLTPIPDNIVDALVERLRIDTLSVDTDYKPLQCYLAPRIEQALASYSRSKNYIDLQPLMQSITPSKYKSIVEPDYHPDRIEEYGINYLQALSANIARDPSISVKLHTELITLIASSLWSDPLDSDQIKAFLSNLTTQTYPDGRKVFVYDKNATDKPLVAINGHEYMPVYRTLEGKYIIAKPSGGAEVLNSLSLFKQAMASKNYSLRVNNEEVNIDTNIGLKKLNYAMLSLTTTNLPYKPSGIYEDSGSQYYNMYVPNKYLGIIRKEHKQELSYKGPESHPTITKLLTNITYDHDGDTMYNKFLQFLAHKLKTLDHSPIVFQLMGVRGTGKSTLIDMLRMLTDAAVEVSFSASNAQFNGHTEGMMFLVEEEGLVTKQLINKVKSLSGSSTVNIEKKGIDITTARNIGTYVFNTNKTMPMAETIDDRRFVTFSSFKAPKLNISNLKVKIALELENFALCLRDTKLEDQLLYLDANSWHDSIHYSNFEENQSKTQHPPSQVANIIYRLHTLTGRELHMELTSIFGENYHYVTTKRSPATLFIPLQKHPKLVKIQNNSELTHEITREQLKAVELDRLCIRDTNKSNVYGMPYYKLKLELSVSQIEEWQAAYDGITPIPEDIDL